MKVPMTMIVILGLTLGGCDAATSGAVREHAQEDAPVVDCQGVDSDRDGYVRCTVGDGANVTEAIECRTSLVMSYQRGCAPMRLSPGGAR